MYVCMITYVHVYMICIIYIYLYNICVLQCVKTKPTGEVLLLRSNGVMAPSGESSGDLRYSLVN